MPVKSEGTKRIRKFLNFTEIKIEPIFNKIKYNIRKNVFEYNPVNKGAANPIVTAKNNNSNLL